MSRQKRAVFSPDSKYFAHIGDENLLIWETASKIFKECKFDRDVNTCSSIKWIPVHHKYNSSKKPKLCHNYPVEYSLLVVGTVKGDILVYNINTRNLYLHLVARHNDAVNDMYFYEKNNSFFTCSSDQHIAIWDISSGKEISKWKAGENPVVSICVIDDENLLSSSTEILWWNISEKTVLKKFSGHSTEIYKLLPVNADSMNSCYFLSAAVDDTKINAWSLNSSKCDAPVASFSLSHQPEDMDISRISSKDKPLVLATVTKDGYLHLFEHALNGNISQPVKPQVSVEINPDSQDFSVISLKLTPDSNTCIIAYETSKSTVEFKHVKIKELLQKDDVRNSSSEISESSIKLSQVNDSSKAGKNLPVNGFSDSVLSNYKKKLRSSTKSPLTVSDLANPIKKGVSMESQLVVKQLDLDNPKSAIEILLEAIEARNDNIIEAIFKNGDPDYVSSVVKILPTCKLEVVLNELNHRLLQKYSETLCRWLKEILHIHLRYLTQCETSIESLNQITKHLEWMKIDETLHKMTVLQGLLNLQTQDSSSDDSDSDNEDLMEL